MGKLNKKESKQPNFFRDYFDIHIMLTLFFVEKI